MLTLPNELERFTRVRWKRGKGLSEDYCFVLHEVERDVCVFYDLDQSKRCRWPRLELVPTAVVAVAFGSDLTIAETPLLLPEMKSYAATISKSSEAIWDENWDIVESLLGLNKKEKGKDLTAGHSKDQIYVDEAWGRRLLKRVAKRFHVSDQYAAIVFARFIRFGGMKESVIPDRWKCGGRGKVRMKEGRKKPGPKSAEKRITGVDLDGPFEPFFYLRQMSAMVCLVCAMTTKERKWKLKYWNFVNEDGTPLTAKPRAILDNGGSFTSFLRANFLDGLGSLALPSRNTFLKQYGALFKRSGDDWPTKKPRKIRPPVSAIDDGFEIVGQMDGTTFGDFLIVEEVDPPEAGQDDTVREDVQPENCIPICSPSAIIAVAQWGDAILGWNVTLRPERGTGYLHCIMYMLTDQLKQQYLEKDLGLDVNDLPGIFFNMHIDRLLSDRGPGGSEEVMSWEFGKLRIAASLARSYTPRDKPNVESAIGRIKAKILTYLLAAVADFPVDQIVTMQRIVNRAKGTKFPSANAKARGTQSGSARPAPQRAEKIRITARAFERLLAEVISAINLAEYSNAKSPSGSTRKRRLANCRATWFAERLARRRGPKAKPIIKPADDLRAFFPTVPAYVYPNGTIRRGGIFGNPSARDEGREGGLALYQFAKSTAQESRWIDVVPAPRPDGFWWANEGEWHTLCRITTDADTVGALATGLEVEAADLDRCAQNARKRRTPPVKKRVSETTVKTAKEILGLNRDPKRLLQQASKSERKRAAEKHDGSAVDNVNERAGFPFSESSDHGKATAGPATEQPFIDPDKGFGLGALLLQEKRRRDAN